MISVRWGWRSADPRLSPRVHGVQIPASPPPSRDRFQKNIIDKNYRFAIILVSVAGGESADMFELAKDPGNRVFCFVCTIAEVKKL